MRMLISLYVTMSSACTIGKSCKRYLRNVHIFQDNNGPLGLLERGNLQKTPRELLADISVTKISSGNNHLALLTHDGRVYTCGCGEAGQLGRIAEVFATRDSRNRKGIGKVP